MPHRPIYLTGNELHWLAGLLEGEGTFLAGPPRRPNQPILAVDMTDQDIIKRVANLLGSGVTPCREQFDHWSPQYHVALNGGSAVSLMKLLYPLMGLRRQGQIGKALACYQPRVRRSYRVYQCIADDVEEHERHWLAGYLEGEGWFIRHRQIKAGREYQYLRVGAQSKDQDVIAQVQSVWWKKYGAEVNIRSRDRREGWNIQYIVEVQGAPARAIMEDIYPFMGERRQAKIHEALRGE